MKPIAIFRHSLTEGPGYFATYLERAGLPWTLVKIDAGDPVPQDPQAFAGLAFMGGPMSVNDDLPWIPPVLQLIREAVARDVPVLGHCLGGQLMSKALGGQVTRAPVKEIGWGEVQAVNSPAAVAWFGDDVPRFEVFQWHGETFSIPPGATHLLESRWCANQAFAIGPHLGLQCHIEMTEELVRSWCETGAREIARSQSPAVQPVGTILEEVASHVQMLHGLADSVYRRWTAGLKP
jgi:GMP synthase-like glutamine amidotransferase